MTYLIYQDNNGWRVARSDGRSDKITKRYSKLNIHLITQGMSMLRIKYKVYRMLERAKQEVRYMN